MPLLPYVFPNKIIIKRQREKDNKNFYKKIHLISTKSIKKNMLSPRKRKVNLSLPRLNTNSININNIKKPENLLEKYLNYDEKVYVKSHENSKEKKMNTPSNKKLYMRNPYEAFFLKANDNYKKENKKKLFRDIGGLKNNPNDIRNSNSLSYVNIKNNDNSN